jgi:hypothetical protein
MASGGMKTPIKRVVADEKEREQRNKVGIYF